MGMFFFLISTTSFNFIVKIGLYLYVFINIISYQPALNAGLDKKNSFMEFLFLSSSFIFISFFYLAIKRKKLQKKYRNAMKDEDQDNSK